MRNERGGGTMVVEQQQQSTTVTGLHNRPKFGDSRRQSDPNSIFLANNHLDEDDQYSSRGSSASLISPRSSQFSTTASTSGEASPYIMSPWNPASPFIRSPWLSPAPEPVAVTSNPSGLIGSIIREEGHVYSIAASEDLLYTGSDSKNIRVWKNMKEYTGFKCHSGLVKAIIIAADRIFTGHQDGKIRIWKISEKNSKVHKLVESLPSFKDYVKSSFNPKNYIETRRSRSVRVKHYDAVSSLSLCEEFGLLYSGSWDRTMKVWRIADSKCVESLNAHDDAINCVAVGFDGVVFSGSADGTVKVWKRELQGDAGIRHFLIQVLLDQESAVTALAVNLDAAVVYAGSSDGLVNFWEREKHVLVHGGVLKGHKLAVLCLTTAGNLVFSGSADKNICVWRKESGGVHSCLSVLTGHTGPVKCLAVEHDRDVLRKGWVLYSGSLDKSVKVWRVSEPGLDPKEGKHDSVSMGDDDYDYDCNNRSWGKGIN